MLKIVSLVGVVEKGRCRLVLFKVVVVDLEKSSCFCWLLSLKKVCFMW